MFFPLLLTQITSIECHHDEEFKDFYEQYNRVKHSTPNPNQDYFINGVYSPVRKPIRITYDFSYLTSDANYTLHCDRPNKTITWGNVDYVCKEEDLMNTKKREILVKTLESLKEYLHLTLSVTPLKHPVTLKEDIKTGDQTLYLPAGEKSDTDMHLTIVPRPYGESNTLASALSIQWEVEEGRPVQGIIYVNLAKLPSSPQSYKMFPNEFFATCFHETCHALGLSKHLVKNWIDRKTGVKYPADSIVESLTWGKKTFTFVVTPEAHRYATKRFGVENFTLHGVSVKSGIEIEDGGGDGTKGSHPEGRTYFGEVMVGLTSTNAIISDLTLALLKDTGWYDVNYKMVKGHIWGNGVAITGAPNNDFPIQPLQTVNMPNHLCNEAKKVGCIYDYTAIGVCATSEYDCSSSSKDKSPEHEAFCKTQAFYNPKSYNIRGRHGVFDYMMYMAPYNDKSCIDPSTFRGDDKDEEAGLDSRCFQRSGGLYSGRYGCFRTRCDGLKLFVKFGKYEYQCTKEGEKVGGLTSKIICPNPSYICRSKAVSQYLPEDPFSANFTPSLLYEKERLGPDNWLTTASLTTIIVIGSGILVALIVIISCCCCKKKRRVEKEDTYDDSFDDSYEEKKSRKKHHRN